MKILDKIEEKLREHLPNNVKHLRLRFGKHGNKIIGYDEMNYVVYITDVEIDTTVEGKLVFTFKIAHSIIVVVED